MRMFRKRSDSTLKDCNKNYKIRGKFEVAPIEDTIKESFKMVWPSK